jgi:lipopolysaccharide transport protein LptA
VKTFHLIALLALVGGGWSHAQTNVNSTPTVITSEHGFYSNAARQVIYTGNVHVDDPRMTLTCEQLTADLPQAGGHINHLVALTNVVMDSVDEKGQTNHATSDKAVYDYKVVDGVTNETVTLTGNAKVENAQGWMTGEPIVWDRANNSMHAENQKMIFRQNIAASLVNSNAPAVQQTNLPMSKTNFPPGTIQNIDRMTIPSGTTNE